MGTLTLAVIAISGNEDEEVAGAVVAAMGIVVVNGVATDVVASRYTDVMVAIMVGPISKGVESSGEVMELWYLFRNIIFLWFMGKPGWNFYENSHAQWWRREPQR